MSIFDRLYGSTKEEIFAREVAKNMDEVIFDSTKGEILARELATRWGKIVSVTKKET